MKILTFFLYLILTLCILWLSIFLFGSSLVRYGSNYYFGTNVTLTGVEVTPRLQLNINKVDFDFSGSAGKFNRAGSVRAIKIRFSDLISQPSAYLSTGPAIIESLGQFKNLAASIHNRGLFNNKNQYFEIGVNDLIIADNLYSDHFEMEGGLALLENKIEASAFTFTNFESKNSPLLEVGKIGGRIDEFDFSKPISEQSNLLMVNADQIFGVQPNFKMEFLTMEIFNKLGELETAGSFKDIDLDQEKVRSEEFNFEFRLQDILASNKLFDATFRAQNTTFSDFELVLPEIKGVSEVTNDTLSLSAFGPLKSFRISNQKNFIGEVADGDIQTSIEIFDYRSLSKAAGSIKFNIRTDPHMVLDFDFLTDVDGYCLTERCELRDLNVDYEVSAGDGSLFGTISCPSGNCFSDKSRHSLETVDTNLLLSEIVRTRAFNPLVLMAFFTELRSKGLPTARGHRFSF